MTWQTLYAFCTAASALIRELAQSDQTIVILDIPVRSDFGPLERYAIRSIHHWISERARYNVVFRDGQPRPVAKECVQFHNLLAEA